MKRSKRRNPLHLDRVQDPFDKRFHSSVAKAGKKALVYHGTSTVFFWPIVEHGLSYDKERAVWDNTTPGVYVTFDDANAGLYAHHAVEAVGGKEIFFVLEVPVADLSRDLDDAEKWDRNRNLQAVSHEPIPPERITGVIYPASIYRPETPITEFIEKVEQGYYEDVEGLSPERAPGEYPVYQLATPSDPIHSATNYLVDLIQYAELDHLLHGEDWLLFQQIVMENLALTPYRKWRLWRGRDWLRFAEKVTGEKVGPGAYVWDVLKRERWTQLPFYRVEKRFQEDDSFRGTEEEDNDE